MVGATNTMNRAILILFTLFPVRAFLVNPSAARAPRCVGRSIEHIRLHGVLSKAIILSSKARYNQQKNKKRNGDTSKNTRQFTPRITLNVVSGAIKEALFRQDKILDALSENERNSDGSSRKNITESMIARRLEVMSLTEKLQCLQDEVYVLHEIQQSSPSTSIKEKKNELIRSLKELGFESLLYTDPDEWMSRKDKQKEHGRPKGFDGLVFTSPAGVPILVGREGAHSDEALRRVSQGSDLWFQVSDYDGSRVLLRTSLRRGMKGSRQCMQMAADLAAYFSSHHYDEESVRIMYTDSKHVAKRGSKVGQIRQSKSLGYMVGHPDDVKETASAI